MLYYRVKPEFDNAQLYKLSKTKFVNHGFLVGNELFTKTEFERNLQNLCVMYGYDKVLEVIETPKTNTFYSFGARFVLDENKVIK